MAAAAAASSTSAALTQKAIKPIGWFNRSALLIKDPARSVPFYKDHFGFTLVHKKAATGADHYFLATLEDDVIAALPSDTTGKESAEFVAGHKGTFLELVHEHGSESDDSFSVNNGNVEPHRGFGHIAVTVPDLNASCEVLDKAGVAFHKKPWEGRMKSLAFALDPDGYWIEIIGRTVGEVPGIGKRPVFAQTMLRVADPAKALAFFRDALGMTLLQERHFGPGSGDFSLFFLASLPEGEEIPATGTDAAGPSMTAKNLCVIELTHNHGTEKDDSFSYHNGYTDPRGFLHVGFTCDDKAAAAKALGVAEDADQAFVPRDGYKAELHSRS